MLLGFATTSKIPQTLAGARTSSIQSEIKRSWVGLTGKENMIGLGGTVVWEWVDQTALLSSPHPSWGVSLLCAPCHHQVLLWNKERGKRQEAAKHIAWHFGPFPGDTYGYSMAGRVDGLSFYHLQTRTRVNFYLSHNCEYTGIHAEYSLGVILSVNSPLIPHNSSSLDWRQVCGAIYQITHNQTETGCKSIKGI